MKIEENQFEEDSLRKKDLIINELFINKYKSFCNEFDSLISDPFNGIKLDQLVNEFYSTCSVCQLTKSIEYFSLPESNYPKCTNQEAIEEDLKILKLRFNNDDEEEEEKQASEEAKLLADFFKRAAQASYLKITYNKLKFKQDNDRSEPFKYARFAIRFNALNYEAARIYMITLGWYLDTVRNVLERTSLAGLFCSSIDRCLESNPDDAIAHHLLGRYRFNVAKLSWIEKKVASRFMDPNQLRATFSDASSSFLKAHELDREMAPTGLWMARVTIAERRPIEETRKWIELNLSANSKEPSNEIERLEALELRSKLRL